MVFSLADTLWSKYIPMFYVNINGIFCQNVFFFYFSLSKREAKQTFIFLKTCKFLRHSFLYTVVNLCGLLSVFSWN